MSQQNPIHRDGQQPLQDSKEALSQSQAEIERAAPLPEDRAESLTGEQKDELRKQAANQRLANVLKDVANED